MVVVNPSVGQEGRNTAALAGLLTNQPVYGVYRAIDDLFGQAMFDE